MLVNFSHNSEHYMLTYNVLKLIVKNNPQIKNLILGCSYHNISTFYDRCLFNEKYTADHISNMLLTRYFTMIDNKSKLILIENNFSGVLKSSKDGIMNMINSFTGNYSNYQDYEFIGKYYQGGKRSLTDIGNNRAIWLHFYKDVDGSELEDFSSLQLEYLKKILSFCKENNIKVFLLNTPVHDTYFRNIPEKFITGYYSIMKGLEESYNVTLLDYPESNYPDDYFGDSNHLNRAGASVFTPKIMERINQNQN